MFETFFFNFPKRLHEQPKFISDYRKSKKKNFQFLPNFQQFSMAKMIIITII